MKLPKFLQSFLNEREVKRHIKKMEKAQSKPQYQIEMLRQDVDKVDELSKKTLDLINQVLNERTQEELKKRREYEDQTDPFKADKWKVVYDAKGQVSTVYFNGQELYGVTRFDIDFDPTTNGQTPLFTYEGHGSIEIITESE